VGAGVGVDYGVDDNGVVWCVDGVVYVVCFIVVGSVCVYGVAFFWGVWVEGFVFGFWYDDVGL